MFCKLQEAFIAMNRVMSFSFCFYFTYIVYMYVPVIISTCTPVHVHALFHQIHVFEIRSDSEYSYFKIFFVHCMSF